MPNRKSRPEPALLPPIDFHAPSNGEFCPIPPTARAQDAERRWLQMVEDKHRRLGLTRREFANSACGMAAALLAINQAACSSSKPNASRSGGGGLGGDAGGGPGCGMPAGMSSTPVINSGGGMFDAGAPSMMGGMPLDAGGGSMPMGGDGRGSGGAGGAGGLPTNAGSAGYAGMPTASGGMGGFGVTEEMTEDMEMAMEMMSGNEFIFDVQTHTATPLQEPWNDGAPDERALDFIMQIFVQSDTTVAVLSGAPNERALGPPNIAARDQTREIIDRIGGPRLLIHGNAEPERGPQELDYMAELAEEFELAAWKVYPHEGDQLLDSDEFGPGFVERARELGVLMVAAHRGLWDNGGYMANASPRDLVRTAAAAPDIDFLVYHSGYERMTNEAHAYNSDADDQFGVDRLLKALEETGIGPNGNVYAELGSTWANIMTEPEQAAHVLGKLLVALGPDRILWGTDCVFNGIPQSQITAFRMFQIPEQMQEEFGYPALTPEIKAKIFGLNGARIYGVDPDATRTAITNDSVSQLRTALLEDPRSVPLPDRRRYEGPRTRREFFQLLKRDRFFRHG